MLLLLRLFVALTFPTFSGAVSVDYKVRNAPGASTADTYLAIREEIVKAGLEKREPLQVNTTLFRRWKDATLLKFGHERTAAEIQARPLDIGGRVEITCTDCYISGTAFASLSTSLRDPANYIQEVLGNFTEDVRNVTEGFEDYIGDYYQSVLTEPDDNFDWKNFELPTFNQDIDFDIPEVPGCNLTFRFDDLEIYMSMNTVLGAGVTYEMPLYRSLGPLGIHITDDLELGVFVTADLILSVDGEIDISSGFHIKLASGLGIQITLFADEVSDLTLNGGQFEFIPVTINSGSVVFSAILRIGVHAGFEFATPRPPAKWMAAMKMPAVGSGIEVGVFANVAEFITNVTHTPEDEDCAHKIVQSYQLALGATAGATVAIGTDTWGPMPETSVPIWYTEMARGCAAAKTATAPSKALITTAPEDRKREDLVTTTASTEIIHTGVNCKELGRVNCPASLQNTSQSTETRTLITALPAGSTFFWPLTVENTMPSPVAFRKNAETIPETAGSPVSYIPPSPTSTSKFNGFVDNVQDAADDATEDAEDTVQKAKKNKGLIIGLSVGIGAPILLAMVAGLLVLYRRRRTSDLVTRGAYATPDTAPRLVQTPGQPPGPTPTTPAAHQDYKAVKGASVEEREITSTSS